MSIKGLFIGARVRIKWSKFWPELKGTEGRIIAKGSGKPASLTAIPSEWIVRTDLWGSECDPETGIIFGPSSGQLEPIMPDSNSEGSWEEIDKLLPNLREKETV